MPFMLCLRNVTQFPLLPCFSFTKSTQTRPCVTIGHVSPSLAGNNYMRCTLRRGFHPVNCAAENPSMRWRDGERYEKIARGTMRASLVLACAVGVFSASLFRMNPVAIAAPREMYQKAPRMEEFPSVGKAALESLLDVTSLLVSNDLDRPLFPFKLPSRASTLEVNNLKKHAVWLIKCGKAEEALDFLQSAYSTYKDDPEPAYNVDMALGKYQEALERNCLSDGDALRPSDARLPLYKVG
ncbi:hypothetical protein Tsubulata_020885, partial [Turnera subulata]